MVSILGFIFSKGFFFFNGMDQKNVCSHAAIIIIIYSFHKSGIVRKWSHVVM